MAILTKELQKTNISLLSLYCSVNFDKDRVVIADHELSENFLTLYLEDKNSPATEIDESLMYKLPISKFAEIIESNDLNSYEGTLYTHHGRPYEGRVIINHPIRWFNQDASLDDQKYALDLVKNCLVKSSLIN
jgi:hypothetical protein